MMNADEKIRYEGLIVKGLLLVEHLLNLLLRSYDHNWQDDLLRQGFVQNSNFSYSGGTDQFTNFMSIGYTEDTGIIDKLKGFNRITARYNSEYKANETVKFDLILEDLTKNLMIQEIVIMYKALSEQCMIIILMSHFFARDAAGNITLMLRKSKLQY
jgi:hypothetical protein